MLLARLIIGKSQRKHNGQPKDSANDDELRTPGAVTRVHEVKNHERGLRRGDAESDDDIELAKILESRQNRNGGTSNQREKDHHVNYRRNDVFRVFRHGVPPNFATDAGRSDITTGTGKSTRYRRSASTTRRFRRACCIAAGSGPAS